MKIEKTVHEGVLEDGQFKNQRGAVEVNGAIRMSRGEGCGVGECTCSEGHWMTAVLPRTSDGRVEVVRIVFDNSTEMELFFKTHQLLMKPKKN